MTTTDSVETDTNQSDNDVLDIMVYSNDRTVREQVRLALGNKIASDLPAVKIHEFATYDAAVRALDNQTFDGGVFDGEAAPGGMGLVRQMHDEYPDPPPVVMLIARPQDAWLAAWSKTDAVSAYPVDPIRLPDDLATVIRNARDGVAGPLYSEFEAPGRASRHAG